MLYVWFCNGVALVKKGDMEMADIDDNIESATLAGYDAGYLRGLEDAAAEIEDHEGDALPMEKLAELVRRLAEKGSRRK